MKLRVVGKNLALTDGIKEAVKNKTAKIEKFVQEDTVVAVCVSAKKNKPNAQRTEITVRIDGSIIRAEVEDDDLYKTIGMASDIVVARLKRLKERKKQKATRESIRGVEVKEENSLAKIAKTKRVDAQCMTVEEACEEMYMTDHDFYVFRDMESGMLSVVYKKEDDEYGVIFVE